MDITSILFADLYTKYNTPPLEAATKLANVWCNNPTTSIDLWGMDYVSKEFITEFLNICKKNGKLLDVLKVYWLVHNAPGGIDHLPSTNDLVNIWMLEWVQAKMEEGSLDYFSYFKILNPKIFVAYYAACHQFIENLRKE